jgi:hypothetical protein
MIAWLVVHGNGIELHCVYEVVGELQYALTTVLVKAL